MGKKLVFSPHIDDEVLGCGGILNSDCIVIYAGADESSIDDSFSRPSMEERLKELQEVTNITGHSFEILPNKVNNYKERDMLPCLESAINRYKPEEVYVPHPSYNKDHKEMYNAAITALRPHDTNHFVNRAFVYEQPHMFFWDHAGVRFEANYFVPIDIDRKIRLYTCMESQVRSFRSPDHIKSLAKLRGAQCNSDYAEAFQLIRWAE